MVAADATLDLVSIFTYRSSLHISEHRNTLVYSACNVKPQRIPLHTFYKKEWLPLASTNMRKQAVLPRTPDPNQSTADVECDLRSSF